ncbi:hypothetical protein [Methylobacterium nigriterrae]|uniref:hypothetical protein n=1 Tax=Methylobacterium nigriterrae TaxID=3127512 RepID=UPI003013284B
MTRFTRRLAPRRSRVAPGPLRIVRRRPGPSVGGGALFGGLLGLAVLAAFSLPLAVSYGPARDDAAQAVTAYVGTSADEGGEPEPAGVQAAAAMPAPAPGTEPAPARPEPPAASAARFELPVLQDEAAEVEPEVASAAPPVAAKPAARKAAPKRGPANLARAANP